MKNKDKHSKHDAVSNSAQRGAYKRKDVCVEKPKCAALESVQKHVGKQVAFVRTHMFGWSQEYLAKQANLSGATVSNLERGQCSDLGTLVNISDALKVPVFIFFPDFAGIRDDKQHVTSSFGGIVKELRKSKGVSQRWLADVLDVEATQTISAMEKEKQAKKYGRVYQISQVFGVEVEDLLPANQEAYGEEAREAVELYIGLKKFRDEHKIENIGE